MKKLILSLCLGLTISTSWAQIPNTLTAEDKIFGLSKFWQEVNYNFVYLNKVNRPQWDSTYKVMIKTVQQTSNDYEYYRLLQKFCSLLKDGHTNVFFPAAIQKNVLNGTFGKYRLGLKNIEHKAIVTSNNSFTQNLIPLGTEIITVNGLPAREYASKYVEPYYVSSTSYVTENQAIYYLLEGYRGQTFRIGFRTPKGKVQEIELTLADAQDKDINPMPHNELLTMKWYNQNKIAYVALNSFSDEEIVKTFVAKLPELAAAKGIIIDLRNNGGGDGGVALGILRYLCADTVFAGSKTSTRQILPSYRVWGSRYKAKDTVGNAFAKRAFLAFQEELFYPIGGGTNRIPDVKGKVIVPTVILIGNGTASAAEDFLIYADKKPNLIKMGQNTYGSTGQPAVFNLPGGGIARVCTKKDTYPDGREFVGYGIKPDIEVIPTVADLISGKDETISKALVYLKNKI